MKTISRARFGFAVVLGIIFGFQVSDVRAADAAAWTDYVSARAGGTEPILPDFSFAGYHHGEIALPDVTQTHTVFDVTTFGAVAGDGLSDKLAIIAAIAVAEASGQPAIIFFPPGRFRINDLTDDHDQEIRISQSNIVLKGSGAYNGGTELFAESEMNFTDVTKLWTSRWIISIVDSSGAGNSKITDITANATRESFTITVADASGLSVGQRVELHLDSAAATADFLGPYSANAAWTDIISGAKATEEHVIAAISGNDVTFKEPIHYDVNASHGWELWQRRRELEEVGVEDIAFIGNFKQEFDHHLDHRNDGGWSCLRMIRIFNGWVRRCRFVDWNRAITISGQNVTVMQNALEGNNGHGGMVCTASHALVGLMREDAYFKHGPEVSNESSGVVFWRYRYQEDTAYGAHGSQPWCTLHDMNCGGMITPGSGPSGASSNQPSHLKYMTFWNFTQTGPARTNQQFWRDSGNSYPGIVMPLLVGFQSQSGTTTVDVGDLSLNESFNTAVTPVSLFEAQLEHRIGSLPTWVADAIALWDAMKPIVNMTFEQGESSTLSWPSGSFTRTDYPEGNVWTGTNTSGWFNPVPDNPPSATLGRNALWLQNNSATLAINPVGANHGIDTIEFELLNASAGGGNGLLHVEVNPNGAGWQSAGSAIALDNSVNSGGYVQYRVQVQQTGDVLFRLRYETGNGYPGNYITGIRAYGLPDNAPMFLSDPIIEINAAINTAYLSSIADDASDVDLLDTLTFTKLSGPSWLSVATTGSISGTPGINDIGVNSFSVRVTDSTGNFDDAVLQISVPTPTPFYVDVNVSGGSGNGSSWTNAGTDIQAGIDAVAAGTHTEVWVAQGNFDLTASLVLKSGVAVYGGFVAGASLRSDRDPKANTVSLRATGSFDVADVENGGVDLRLDGFTLTRIAGNGRGLKFLGDHSETTVIENCIIRDHNRSGIWFNEFQSGSTFIQILNCEILNNTNDFYGGGVLLLRTDATAANAPRVLLKNCVIDGNQTTVATRGGGGVYTDGGILEMINCVVSNNVAMKQGGGLFARSFDATALPLTVTNCTFYGNEALESDFGNAVAIRNTNTAAIRFTNNIFAFNTNALGQGTAFREESGPLADAVMTNCCFFGNGTPDTGANPGIIILNPVIGDPALVNAAADDFHLLANSSCINRGTLSGAPATDLDGTSRPLPLGTLPDVGAFEESVTGVDAEPSAVLHWILY